MQGEFMNQTHLKASILEFEIFRNYESFSSIEHFKVKLKFLKFVVLNRLFDCWSVPVYVVLNHSFVTLWSRVCYVDVKLIVRIKLLPNIMNRFHITSFQCIHDIEKCLSTIHSKVDIEFSIGLLINKSL